LFQADGKVGGRGAGDKIAVGVMPEWQPNHTRQDAGVSEATSELVRRLLTGLVFILVKDDVNRPIWSI